MTVVNGILCLSTIALILQLWLLTSTMNAYLGGDQDIVWPAGLSSLTLLSLNLYLLRFLYRF